MQPQFTCRLTIIVIIIARSARIFFLDIYLSIRPVGSPLGTRAARPPLSGSSMGSMPPSRGDAGAAPPKFVAEGAGGETRQCQEEWPRATGALDKPSLLLASSSDSTSPKLSSAGMATPKLKPG